MVAKKELAREATGPLKGVRILDLTSVVFGAYATQILADQGAEVIKLEDPGSKPNSGGDIMRWAGHVPDGAPRDLGAIFVTINRNKRSVSLDLKKPENQARIRKLAATCDVVAASVRYEALQRLGLDYESLKAVKPDIVYVHAAGYGSDGPYAGRPAYDDLIQAACGLADLLNRTDGNPRPRLMPTLLADKTAGLFMAQAVTAALFHKAQTGEGQFVEVPMLECITSFTLVEHYFEQVFEPPLGPWGYGRVCNPNRRPYETRDGFIGILPYTDAQWELFFQVAGWTETIAKDPRFADPTARSRNSHELYGLVDEVTRTRTTDEWFEILQKAGIPVERVNRLDDLEHDPHLEAVEFFQRYEHPQLGPYKQMKPPVRFAKTPANIRRHPPRLGEHTDEILAEIEALGDERKGR
ncbi:MAG: CoA transferase [Phenylobacterium sp.]